MRGLTAAGIVLIVLVAVVAFWHDISPVVHDLLQLGQGEGGGG